MALKYTGSELMLALVASMSLMACGTMARLPLETGTGPRPELLPPDKSVIPSINVAGAVGWSGDDKPAAADGPRVLAFARGLDHPRWIYALPNGDPARG
jgi:glucose/arabinose dehydrogenase